MSCGICFRGFVTGDWGMPEGKEFSELTPEEQLPPAEKLPAVESVAEAKRLLAEDRQVALEIASIGPASRGKSLPTNQRRPLGIRPRWCWGIAFSRWWSI